MAAKIRIGYVLGAYPKECWPRLERAAEAHTGIEPS